MVELRRVEDWDGAAHVVVPVPGFRAQKVYLCPHCNQDVPVGAPHVVVWPEGAEDLRRHWHTPCWRRR